MNTQRRPTSYVTLDLTLPDVQTSLAVTQGDTTRRIVATIQDGGRPFELPRKWTAMLTGTKPDGKFLYNSCVIDYSGRIVYDFASGTEIATAIGDYAVTFEIYDEAGDKVSSPSLWLSVKPDKTRDHASNDQFTAAQEILGRLNKVEDGLEFLEGDQDSEYLAYEGASLIRVNKEAPNGYDALKVSSYTDYLHIVKFDSTLYEVATNELAGYWVEINGKRAYVGSNTVDSLTLYTDHTKTRPRAFFVSAGTLIHILGDDVTNAMLYVIGAAPSGFGLGTSAKTISSMDLIDGTGTYDWGDGNVSWIINHYKFNDNYAVQIATAVNGIIHGTTRMRLKENGKWDEWEWVNPPMEVGVEYRTTERFKGKAVYTMAVDCGKLPNQGTKNIEGTISNNLVDLVDMHYALTNGDYHRRNCHSMLDVRIERYDGWNWISLTTTGDLSGWDATVFIKYTNG